MLCVNHKLTGTRFDTLLQLFYRYTFKQNALSLLNFELKEINY